MNINEMLTGTVVELPEMMDARERRAANQRRLQQQYGQTLISFTLNIPGPIKVFPLVIQTYEEGLELIHCQCKACGIPLGHVEQVREHTGYEAFLLADAPPLQVKRALAQLEQSTSLGRLFDIDVLDQNGEKVSRTDLGQPERTCLLCGKPAFVCSRSRAHSLEELLERACSIMWDYFARRHADKLAAMACRALLYEVLATPKPGLVDKCNDGSHSDMDISTFETSALALLPYFTAFVTYGVDHCHQPIESILPDLRPMGIQGEIAMLRATGGINTHKGAIFSMGILLAALGIQYGQGKPYVRDEIQTLCRNIAAPLAQELEGITPENARTNGERLYALHGVSGARGEAAAGLPTLFQTALPRMDGLLAEGWSLNDAGVATLLDIMAVSQDTNIVARSSYERMEELRRQTAELIAQNLPAGSLLEQVAQLDQQYIQEHVSPGGSADLLALTYFLRFLEQDIHYNLANQSNFC